MATWIVSFKRRLTNEPGSKPVMGRPMPTDWFDDTEPISEDGGFGGCSICVGDESAPGGGCFRPASTSPACAAPSGLLVGTLLGSILEVLFLEKSLRRWKRYHFGFMWTQIDICSMFNSY